MKTADKFSVTNAHPCDDIKKEYVLNTYRKREAHHPSPFELGEQIGLPLAESSGEMRFLSPKRQEKSVGISKEQIGLLCLHRSSEALTLHLQLGHIGTVSKEQIGLPRALSITHLLKTQLSPED